MNPSLQPKPLLNLIVLPKLKRNSIIGPIPATPRLFLVFFFFLSFCDIYWLFLAQFDKQNYTNMKKKEIKWLN